MIFKSSKVLMLRVRLGSSLFIPQDEKVDK